MASTSSASEKKTELDVVTLAMNMSEATTALVKKGVAFKRYFVNEVNKITSRPSFLYLDPSTCCACFRAVPSPCAPCNLLQNIHIARVGKGPLGTLCWRDGVFPRIEDAKDLKFVAQSSSSSSSDSSGATKIVSTPTSTIFTATQISELSMELVDHLWLLKQSGLLKTAETLAAKAECCFTIVSRATGNQFFSHSRSVLSRFFLRDRLSWWRNMRRTQFLYFCHLLSATPGHAV